MMRISPRILRLSQDCTFAWTNLSLIQWRGKKLICNWMCFEGERECLGIHRRNLRVRKGVPLIGGFDSETPELTSFVVKVLSLTCSSSACERNWSTFNQIHTKRRNRLAISKLNTLVYIMYNKKLKDRHLMKKALKEDQDPLVIDIAPSDDEWVAETSNGCQSDESRLTTEGGTSTQLQQKKKEKVEEFKNYEKR